MMLSRIKSVAWNLAAVAICIVLILPFLWVVLESFHSNIFGSSSEIFRPTLSNYRYIFLHTQVFRQFGNSFIACFSAMVISVPVTAMAAYGYSRIRFRGKRALYVGLLVTQVLPATALVIPLYHLWALGHLFNNLVALGVAYAALNMALGTLLVKNFLDNLPVSLDEAAMLEGCSRWQIFWHILRPLVTPAIAATAVFVFVNAWQDYLLASSLITNTSDFTVNVGLYSFEGALTTNWGAILATAVLVSLPSVVMFAAAQRYFVRVVSGGIKG
jgi:ABC-type glycerol-3-phosphate transport system permease component